MPNAIDVANYFLATQTQESDLTNLKLQKLCAYAQAMSLALLDRPLFDEDIEAWTHGPVVPGLYNQYATYGSAVLPECGLSEVNARQPFDDEQKFILELTKSYYGAFTAWALRDRSHRDFPGRFGSRETIAKSAIREAFQTDPLVRKFRDVTPCHYDPHQDTLVPESEVLDALEC